MQRRLFTENKGHYDEDGYYANIFSPILGARVLKDSIIRDQTIIQMAQVRQVYAKRQVAEIVAGEKLQYLSESSDLSIGAESESDIMTEPEMPVVDKLPQQSPLEGKQMISLTAETQKEGSIHLQKSAASNKE